MTSQAGWYLDASKIDKPIQLIKLIREMLRNGLKEAKELYDRSKNSPILLSDSLPNRNWSGETVTEKDWIQAVAATGATLKFEGFQPGSTAAACRAVELLGPVENLLANLKASELQVLARLYGVKGRGRMNGIKLIQAIGFHLAYSEALYPGRAEILISEAKLVTKGVVGR
jgi:hypothetical protein